ncbi:MAG: DinB family protein, partial [bacterium]
MEATMRLADSVIAELELEAGATRRVLERIPEDKLSWRPHRKSMSLGQLALHVASTPAGVAKIASMDTMEAPNFASRAEPASKDEVLQTLETSFATAKEFLQSLDDERAEATWTMTRAGETIMAMPRIGLI